MAVSAEINHTQSLMSFGSTIALDAVQGLEKSRSGAFLESITRRKQRIEAEKVKSVWDIKPIDFSVKNYQPRPPPRNTRQSMIKGWNGAKSTTLKFDEDRLVDPSVPQLQLPTLLMEKDIDPRPEFKAKYRPPSSQTSKMIFVRDGKFQPERYVTDSVGYYKRDLFRQLEDFRQYHKFGIFDFDTSFPRDPRNLRFKHGMLSMTLPELSTSKQVEIRSCESDPLPRLRHPPKWQRELHHPRSAYKKGRSAHSALMERIQSNIGWMSEKEKISGLRRPDIYDHKTKDWCDVTRAPDEQNGPYPIA